MLLRAIVLACLTQQPLSAPQSAPAIAPATAPQPQPASSRTVLRPATLLPAHWAQRLGVRAMQVSFPARVLDRCVLVPDAATYLDELSQWTAPGGEGGTWWPVLIEDEVLTPLFVRRFKPAELIRRPAVNAALTDDPQKRREAIENVVVHALGGDAESQTIAQLFDAAGYRPPGVVIASASDPAWTAAVALAAGRAQPIIWIDDDFGHVNAVLTEEQARGLSQRIAAGIDALGYSRAALGDDVDAITLCRNLPVAAKIDLPAEQRLVREGQYADGHIAVSDFLGRNADGSHWAMTGQIFGDEARCAYIAMCSLFLPHESATLFNTYSNDGEWGRYAMEGAADALSKLGLSAQSHAGPEAMGEAGWRRLIAGGVSSDVVFMNTGGYHDFFMLNGGQGRPGDVPVLNQPAALHLIHSWSLRSPAEAATVGGRWLAHGAYAMVGSCFEPFLAAFQQPKTLGERCAAGVPLLVAARRWGEDGFAVPWRVVTLGDPLMVLRPAAAFPPARVPPSEGPAIVGENLLSRARDLMRKFDADNDPAALVESIRLLELLGQDDIALQMWRLGRQREIPSGRAASAVLGILFRRRDAEGFLQAWNEGGPRTAVQFDMLWHLMGPRLSGAGSIDRDALAALEAAVRSDMPAIDVERLAPIAQRIFGQQHVQQFIAREVGRATDPEQQRLLREIAGKY